MPKRGKHISVQKGKMPANYREQRRMAKRNKDVFLATKLGLPSRHLEDPEGSTVWINTGIWPK